MKKIYRVNKIAKDCMTDNGVIVDSIKCSSFEQAKKLAAKLNRIAFKYVSYEAVKV